MLKHLKQAAATVLSFLVSSPLEDLQAQVQHLQEVNSRLFEIISRTSGDLLAAHTKVFVAQCGRDHLENAIRVNEGLHQAEVNALKMALEQEKARVLGLVDSARCQAATNEERDTFRVLDQLIISISTGRK